MQAIKLRMGGSVRSEAGLQNVKFFHKFGGLLRATKKKSVSFKICEQHKLLKAVNLSYRYCHRKKDGEREQRSDFLNEVPAKILSLRPGRQKGRAFNIHSRLIGRMML
uniref:Uncharacterized protein n=1 Tax=Schistocephalus solidus TaxID=70667 RepID=A0A0V0J1F9_SCHSO